MKRSALRLTLGVMGIVQVILGMVFLFLPVQFASVLGFADFPAWIAWPFAMFGARALGFAYGMFLAMRQPEKHRAWIGSMIVVQAIDWLATGYFLLRGAVTLPQVSAGALILPIISIVLLWLCFPRANK